ncbi:MAG: hypothetical protein ACFBQW_09450 [Sphingomonadaceae bacterium]
MASSSPSYYGPDRQVERLAVDARTRLHPNEWSSIEVQLIDFTRFGFRARCEAKLLTGGYVTLEVPGIGLVEAKVQWQRDGEFGAEFQRPISMVQCGWSKEPSETLLVRLLFERAEAHRSGRLDEERTLRRHILDSLPVKSSGKDTEGVGK